MTIKHLLTATDFSEWSIHAVRRGFLLAEQLNASYTVMHAMGLDALAPLRKYLADESEAVSGKLKEEALQRLVNLVSDPDLSKGMRAEPRLEEGRAASAVAECANDINADVVLLGARGESLFKRILMGSTATALLHKSASPVLVVKRKPQEAYKRVLVGVDFSSGSAAAIRMALALAPQTDIVLLHVFEIPFEGKMRYAGVKEDIIRHYEAEARQRSLRQLHDLAEEVGLPRDNYTAVVQHGEPALMIMEQAEHYVCDLIAMGKHGAGFTEELLLGSVTSHVLDEAEVDVLVAHE
jgi:nucleotide-binding universal stress UspA family protein